MCTSVDHGHLEKYTVVCIFHDRPDLYPSSIRIFFIRWLSSHAYSPGGGFLHRDWRMFIVEYVHCIPVSLSSLFDSALFLQSFVFFLLIYFLHIS